MFGEIAMYVLSALVLVLGGVSLFVQKIYKVEKETGEKTEIDLPFLGKLKTNYPALAFAFIGAVMGIYTFSKTLEVKSKTLEVKDQWKIIGQFKAPSSVTVNWPAGVLSVFPSFNYQIFPNGGFELYMNIPKRSKLEDIIEQISYNNRSTDTFISARIDVKKEYNSFINKESTNLEVSGDKSRKYKTIEVDVTPMLR